MLGPASLPVYTANTMRLRFFVCPLALIGCSDSSSVPISGGAPSAPAITAGVHPLTQTGMAGAGYFEDPLPIHRAMTAGSYLPSIAGTTHAVLECATLAAGCYSATPLTISTGPALLGQLPANTKLVGYQNNNVYQDNAGVWQMATTVTVNNPLANPNGLAWNVILHASPAADTDLSTAGVPLSWVSDALLVGSFTQQDFANYDGKFIEDSSQLFLIYSKRLQSVPTAQDGIVAQLMDSPQKPSTTAPVTLLAPENNADGGLNSERFACNGSASAFKLIETGNISVVNGKYGMAYSTGSFETPCYKVGIAWSDALLGSYKKITQQDTSNVWQNSTPEPEVLYLLQAQQASWPNYVVPSVQGPGVPSLVQYPSGTWYLFFAGYDPAVPVTAGSFDPKLRQPYVMRLNVSIPQNATVAAAASKDLAGWITAAAQ